MYDTPKKSSAPPPPPMHQKLKHVHTTSLRTHLWAPFWAHSEGLRARAKRQFSGPALMGRVTRLAYWLLIAATWAAELALWALGLAH